MNGETIVTVIIGIVLGLTILGALLGLARKWKKALLRFGIVIIDLIGALLLSAEVSTYIPPETIIDALNSLNPTIAELVASVPSLLSLAFGLVRPLFFIVIFIGSSVASLLVYLICCIFISYKPDEKRYPMAGMLIGAVQGLLIALVLVSPVIGYISLADQAVVAYKDVVGEEAPNKLKTLHEKYVEPVKNHPFIGLTGTASAPIFNAVVSFEIGDDTFNPQNELPILIAGYKNVTVLMGKPLAQFGASEKAAISNITSLFSQSVLAPNVGAEFLSAMTTKWKAGESFAGIAPWEAEGEFQAVVDALYTVFSTSTADTLKRDIVTIGDFVILMVDYDMTSLFSGEDDVLAKITAVNPTTNKTFIKAATELLDANPHMATLRAGVSKLGASLLGSQLGTPEQIRENYGEMVTSVVDVLKTAEGDTNEEKIEALTPTIKEELAKNDIELSDEVLDEASRFLLEELEKDNVEIETMTEDDIYSILDKVAAGEITIPTP